jgi:hypothetical protein
MKAPVDITTRQRLFDAYTNPLAIIEHMETHNDEAESPYRQRIETLMASLLTGDGDAQVYAEAQALRQFQAGMTLEEAARHAGFVLGVEYVALLLLGAAAGEGGAQ